MDDPDPDLPEAVHQSLRLSEGHTHQAPVYAYHPARSNFARPLEGSQAKSKLTCYNRASTALSNPVPTACKNVGPHHHGKFTALCARVRFVERLRVSAFRRPGGLVLPLPVIGLAVFTFLVATGTPSRSRFTSSLCQVCKFPSLIPWSWQNTRAVNPLLRHSATWCLQYRSFSRSRFPRFPADFSPASAISIAPLQECDHDVLAS